MDPLRCVIVDEERACVRRLERILAATAGVIVVGVAGDGRAGLDLIRASDPDLAFLDIRMPELDGVQVAEALAGNASPAIIFTTAFADFAVSAVQLGAFDYLLKAVVADMDGWTAIRERLTDPAVGADRINTHVLMSKPKTFVGYPIDGL